MTDTPSRRDFIKTLAAGTAAATFGVPAASYARIIGANERVGVGVMGIGGMGRGHLGNLVKLENAQVTALADVYGPNLDRAAAMAPGAATYRDFREVFDRTDVEAVLIATPDHWHAPQMIMAMEAGKDVYVEKPVSHTPAEGRKMVDAARRHNRIVQSGTQQRSAPLYQRVRDIVQSGDLGPISFVRTWNYYNQFPDGIGNAPDADAPGDLDLDWDMWLGPAPITAYNPSRFGNFRRFWDYAGGNMTDWGTHHFDIVHWAMGVDYPVAVSAIGGKFHLRDNRETPDTLVASYEYPGFAAVYETRLLNSRPLDGRGYGISFHGANGTLVVDRDNFEIIPEKDGDLKPMKEEGNGNAHAQHMHDFLEAVKSRGAVVSDIESGHRSSSATMLGNVAYRTGRTIRWDGEREQVIGDEEANAFVTKAYRAPWVV